MKKSKIYINGKIIGTCDDPEDFVRSMREKRRSGEISPEMNITHYQETDEIYVFTDPGRTRRPLIVVEEGNSKLTEEHIFQLQQGELDWDGLINQGIIEYMDGEGTEYLIKDETYTGLTGLAIVNPDNKRVFSMMAVTGIGFAGCPVYAQFKDDNPSYFAEMEDAAMVVDGSWDIKDYTNVEYSEFEFLGTTIRRISKDYYYDSREGNNYFEPPCVDGVIGLEGLIFTDSNGYDGEAYFYGAEDTATEADLNIVDTILESVKLMN